MQRGDVAGMAEQFMSNWTSEVFRDRCAAQIDSVRRVANPQENPSDPMETFLAQKDSKQLEEFIFFKSKTRDEYMNLLAEMLMMLRQHAGKPVVNLEVLEKALPQDVGAAAVTTNGSKGDRKGDKK